MDFGTTPAPVVAMAANSSFNLVNFRLELIRSLQQAGYEVVVLAPGAAASMVPLGIAGEDLPVDRSGLNPLADLLLLRRFRSRLAFHRASALLSFTVKPNIFGALASRFLGIPAIPNVSGLGTAFLGRGPLRVIVSGLCRLAFANCPVVLFQNPDDLDVFVGQGIVRRDQARLLPGSGINLAAFAPVPIPVGPAVFLMVARLLGDKGVREYAAAARMLKAERPDWRFQLLGPFDPENRTAIAKAEVDQWLAEGAVEYLGTASDVRPAIGAASVMVLPSYREGLPRTLLEGAAMGRPLVATDVPGCRELVEDGTTGFRCTARDSRSLAEAMRRIGDLMPEDRATMGQAARQLVEKKFSVERVTRAYLDVLSDVLPNKDHRA